MEPIIKISIAKKRELKGLTAFLSQPEVDHAFVRPLSERKTTIADRVQNDFADGHWLIARSKSRKIVGCLAVIYHDYVAEISTFFLAQEMRGHHLGSKMLGDAEIILKGLFPEIKMIAIDSWQGNGHLKNMVERLGFAQINAYEDPGKRPQGVKTIVYGKDIK